MWTEILKISSVIALSGIKFIGGTPLSFAFKFSYLETISYTSIGGISGVVMITYFSRHITNFWNIVKSRFLNKDSTSPSKKTFPIEDVNVDLNVDIQYFYNNTPLVKKKRIFTKRNRRIVKLKVKYGLLGVALLTPILLSIPIGTFVATKIINNKKKIILYMSISVLLWSVLLTTIFNVFRH